MKFAETKKGLIEGEERDSYSVFFGIPYAKPPVGDLRWRAPEEMDAWEGVWKACAFANRSMQNPGRTVGFYDKEFYDEAAQTPVAEDSLYLNIWTPAKTADEKLPVAFWIHGGAFTGGFGHEKEFDGAEYAARGVILVTINYRLGVFGFLAHPELSRENAEGVSGNYGILDQLAALRWVSENIAAFGGDPENITVFGQSAGCMSVRTLVSSELSGAQIAKAILQSGLGLSADKKLREAEEEGLRLQKFAGVDSLDGLRKLDAEKLQELGDALTMEIAREKGEFALLYTPVVDGYVLRDGYDALLRAGKVRDIPYMAGSTKNDIGVPGDGSRGPIWQGVCDWAANQDRLGKKPVYAYYFTRQLPGDNAGAFHSSELWYMFGTWKRCWRPLTEADGELSAKMLDAWTNFMKTGSPNAGGAEEMWRPYTEKDPYIKEWDVR